MLTFFSNFKQKVDHLAKVKEENTKLREEKTRLQEKLNQALGKSEQVQKVSKRNLSLKLTCLLEIRRSGQEEKP